MWDQGLAAGDRRDHRLSPALGEEPSEGIGIVGLVRDEPSQGPGEAQQIGRHSDVVQVAGSYQKDPGAPEFVGQGMDRCRAAAARAADRFVEDPPFPPAAERWALTWVLSIEPVLITARLPVSASNISSQIP